MHFFSRKNVKKKREKFRIPKLVSAKHNLGEQLKQKFGPIASVGEKSMLCKFKSLKLLKKKPLGESEFGGAIGKVGHSAPTEN